MFTFVVYPLPQARRKYYGKFILSPFTHNSINTCTFFVRPCYLHVSPFTASPFYCVCILRIDAVIQLIKRIKFTPPPRSSHPTTQPPFIIVFEFHYTVHMIVFARVFRICANESGRVV